MRVELVEVPAAKPRKPRAPRPSVPPSARKDQVTLLLSSDVTLRLTIHAAALRVDRSTLVEGLLRAHLSRFVLQDRGGGALGGDRQGTAVV